MARTLRVQILVKIDVNDDSILEPTPKGAEKRFEIRRRLAHVLENSSASEAILVGISRDGEDKRIEGIRISHVGSSR